MQASEFAEVILAMVDVSESPAAIFENQLDVTPVAACIALNVTLAARDLFAVPMDDGALVIIHEASFKENKDLREALLGITVKDGFDAVNKGYLL